MEEEELKRIKAALGKIEDRITTLEVVKKYDERKQKPAILTFLWDNAEIIAGIALFVAVNLILWEKLNYAS
jgi:hypothetical protein